MKKVNNDFAATALGFMTSVITAVAVIDFDSLDWSKPSTYIKIAAVLLPAIGGFFSEIKSKK